MRTNVNVKLSETTHEGGPAVVVPSVQLLRRSIMSCLLWEREFYENGEDIAARIERLAARVSVADLAALAVEVRRESRMRHVPLLLLSILAERGKGAEVSDAIYHTISRADEPAEFLAIHARRNGVAPSAMKSTISKQMKIGLGRALGKFDEYQLAKYDRDGAVKMRDVIRLVHPKPADGAQSDLWKRALAGELVAPDTWEVALSGGADPRETWTRLLVDRKLGYLALLRNLRNMIEAGVDTALIKDAIIARSGGADRVLPFRYVAAARACPQMEPALDQALSAAVLEGYPLSGVTVILVDVSGSMNERLSKRSDLTRMDAAAALASVIHGDRRVFTFSSELVEVPPRIGMAGVDTIVSSQPNTSTRLGAALDVVQALVKHDRIIVVTDEQTADILPDPIVRNAYMINVASARNGVGYGRWRHVDGFSEAVIRWITEVERDDV